MNLLNKKINSNMGYVRNDFGTLVDVRKNQYYVIITNENGNERKMSISKYQENAERTFLKAQSLVGKNVSILTSQNTADWSESVWFSDIFEM
jgi:hypothetical protein